MKTIFLLARNFPPVICGVGDYTYELYKRLKADGYQVKVITGLNEEVKESIFRNKIECDVYPIIRDWNIKCVIQIVTLLRNERADWFCIQYVPYSFSRLGIPFFLIFLLILVKFSGVRTCVFFHEVSVRLLHNGIRTFVLSIIQRVIAYGLCILSRFVLTNNILYKSYFKPFRILAIPVPSNFHGESENKSKRIMSSEIRLVSFVNRCNRQVIEAIAHCKNIDKLNINFTIIGLGTEKMREDLKEIISLNKIGESVSFYNKFKKADIAQALYKCEIFLQIEYVSKRGEGGISSKSGIAAAAMAGGLAIISSFGDMTDPELFRRNENILFTESGSVESIRKCIHRLYSDESFRRQLSNNAIKTYDSSFSWDRTVKSYIKEFGYN